MDKVKKMPKTMHFKVEFDEKFEKIGNSGFVLGKAKIAYPGKNRNYSNIPKKAFEKAMESLKLIPVVGNWLGDNFGGHDIALETEGNDLKIVNKTIPFGVVPENHNAEWIDVEDEDGNSKKYLKCDVVFWYERYPEPIQFIIDNGGVNQSMEINIIDGSWDENYEYFNINEFEYSALCLLGRDKDNPEKNVEPCFENAEVTIANFALNKEEFKSVFSLMMDELKAVYKEIKQDDNKNDDNKKEFIIYELSHDDIRNEIFNKLNPKDEDGYRKWNYWILEVFDKYVIIEDANELGNYFKVSYTINENEEVELGDFIKVYLMYLTEEEKQEIENMRSDYSRLKEENDNLKTENENYKNTIAELEKENSELKNANQELSEFKANIEKMQREEAENEIFAQYDELLNDDVDYLEIKKNKDTYELEELEKEIALIYVRKQNVKKFTHKNKKSLVKLNINNNSDSTEQSPYGDLFVRYGK